MEWMVFRKSFLLSGELGEIRKRENKRGIFLARHSVDNVRQRREEIPLGSPAAQLEGPLWPPLRLRLGVDDLAHGGALAF